MPPAGGPGLPRPRTRPSQADFRRRRFAVFSAFALVLAVVVYAASGSGGGKGHAGTRTEATRKAPEHLVLSDASWQLPAPTSRAVALAADGSIDLFGGLISNGSQSSAAVTRIDPATGSAEQVATLPDPVHDAGGAAIGSRYFVFGGGASSVYPYVQSYSPDVAAGAPSTSVPAQLPAPRADLGAAAAPDGTVYVAGGYDGSSLSPAVLATRDGTSFRTVADLPVPVRYAAVTVAGGYLLVVGGQTGDAADGTYYIQAVDLKTGRASIAGQLPAPLTGASAAELGGSVYVFGGRSAGHVVDSVYKLTLTAGGRWTATADGALPIPMAYMAEVTLGQTAYLLGGEGQLGLPQRTVMVARLTSAPAAAASAAAPFQGDLLIADRGNDRLLLVNADKQLLWSFPSAAHPAPAEGFYFPDDAFFIRHGTAIITNQENQDTIEEIAYPSGRLIASYGHPNVPGSAPGYLDQPDDAYMLDNGMVTVADAKNCRILFLNPNFTYHSVIGDTGRCQHDIPNDVAYPNGDTPLADGNFLVSEIIGSWVDEVTMSGQVIWSVQLPIAYPSDPQQIGPDVYLIADYSNPGQLLEFTRSGRIVWRYDVTSGEGMLDHPSLAERLPNGLICVNDDYRDRVVIIDPATSRIVWQYGATDTPGTAPGLLNTPDGFDLLLPNGTTPTHLPASGPPLPAAVSAAGG
ncbi:MAG TPA: PQQ-binding-like beta-propeller repeat protein [Acidimicrobiales bacterium]|nr:PQQ-binding-like beta-propeller repeat protein [Acidimicrobiales bacterium]